MSGAACFCFSVVVLAIVVLICSLDAVEQNEYGLKFNWVTKSLSQDAYHGGTHFIGFWNKFLVFPATVQTIEFSDRPAQRSAPMLHTRSKEGLALHLSISFQYRLKPDKLKDLFSVTNMAYENLYTRIARDQLLEAASAYEGPQYWQERKQIGDRMRKLVSEQLENNFATLWDLQLQVIDLPDRYEASITQTQVQQQIIKTRENEQVAAGIRADTEVLQADFMKQIQVVQADAQANFTQETKLASAEASKRRISAEAATVGYVRQKLNLTAAELVRYQQLQSYSNVPNSTFIVDMGAGDGLRGLSAATRVLQLQETQAARQQKEQTSQPAAPATPEPEGAQADAEARGLEANSAPASFLQKRATWPPDAGVSLMQRQKCTSRRAVKPSEKADLEAPIEETEETSSDLEALVT